MAGKRALLATSAILLVASLPASATIVSGQVTDDTGAGIFDVDLDFIDRSTGTSIPLVNDDTDALGFYAVSVPAGDYDVRFKPAQGVAIVAHEERGVKVEGGSMTLDQQLDPGWFVSGRVLDSGGLPAFPLDIDAIDVADGNAMFLSGDNTDAAGLFSIVLPTGQFDLEFEPAVGSSLVPLRMDQVDVVNSTPLGDVVLTIGVRLRGTVLDASMSPVGQVLARTIDPYTGQEIFNIRNTTAVDGRFEVIVEPGLLDLHLIPPRGSLQLPRYLGGVNISAELTLPDLVLDSGVLATGLVLDDGGNPAEGVDLDFVSAWTGKTRFTPRDNTDADGMFAVAVPPGAYDVRFDPPPPTGLAPAEQLGLSLTAATGLPTTQLQAAAIVSGSVQDGAGQPLGGLDLDFLSPGGNNEMPSSRDTTDLSGAFAAIVNPGSYDLRVNPVHGSGLSDATLPSINASGGLDVGTIVLPASVQPTVTGIAPATGPTTGGTTVILSGSGFAAGARVMVGAAVMADVNVIGPTTIQATTPVYIAGPAAVEVINPGAPGVVAAQAFVFTPPVSDPVLTVEKSGPLGTDLLLQWTATGRPHYTVFQGAASDPFGMTAEDATTGLSIRIDAAASPTSQPLLFFSVH